jgi:general stress protein 26
MEHTATENELEKIRELIKEIDFCMLTTCDESGDLHSRPMSTNGAVEFDGDIWFFTYGATHKVREIGDQERVNVSFADIDNQRYLSLSGSAQLVRDKEKMAQLWKPELKAWFPKGLEEPDIALIKVTVKKAEYWDYAASMISHAVSFASSLLTGKQAASGENVRVTLP